MKPLLARDVMTAAVLTVGPGMHLPELERALAGARVSGAPVIDEAGHLVGVVSRADVVRALAGAASEAEAILAYYRDVAGAEPSATEGSRITGERAAALRVADVMATELLTVGPERQLQEVAEMLADRRVHRVLIAEGRRLLGLVSSLDIVRAVADGRLVACEA